MINPFVSAFSFISTSFSFISASGDDLNIPTKNGVLVLTQDNFEKALSQHETLMVKFYLPWCNHCRAFEPEYLKVQQLLSAKRARIKLGEVDAAAEKALVQRHKIIGFPAIRMFKDGNELKYYGIKQADHIVAWVNKNCPDCLN